MEIEKRIRPPKWQRRTEIQCKRRKCLAKFTAANGNVYGSLTLDIRKAGDYSQPLPVAVRVCHGGQKTFLRLGNHTLWKNGWFFAIMRKAVGASN